jgi:hypothetical protein
MHIRNIYLPFALITRFQSRFVGMPADRSGSGGVQCGSLMGGLAMILLVLLGPYLVGPQLGVRGIVMVAGLQVDVGARRAPYIWL